MLGEMDAAAPLHEEALKIRELRQDLAQCHESLGGLSQVALCRGKIDESLALSRRALEMGEQHFGKYHPNTTTCLVNIAAVLALAVEELYQFGYWLWPNNLFSKGLAPVHSQRPFPHET